MQFLISGAGSIGKRHTRNLQTMGCNDIVLCDPHVSDADYADFEEALDKSKPDVVFVCSPSKLHVQQAILAAKAGAHLFIEKPLSNKAEGIDELKAEVEKKNITCMVGCNMRFHAGPEKVKELLNADAIGNVRKATVYCGSYIPDWRPQSDYKKSYSADSEQGGAILDIIHEIDLALWYLGPATITGTTKETADSIGLTVEGTADISLQHTSGALSTVHLSFTEKEYNRFCNIVGERGTIAWDINKKSVVVTDTEGNLKDKFAEPEGYDYNHCYIA